MTKAHILEQIITHLQTDVDAMKKAEQFSHSVATDKENQPKNRHDTLALESSYLAQVQCDRANQMEAILMAYQALRGEVIAEGDMIRLSALVSVEEKGHPRQHYFIGPKTGGWAGLELEADGECVTVITSASPIGQALLGHKTGDTLSVKLGWDEHILTISAVS